MTLAKTLAKAEYSKGKKYSHKVIAQALAIYDVSGNIEEVVRQTGITKPTIQKWIRDRHKYESGEGRGGGLRKAETFSDLYERQKDAILAEVVDLQKLALQQVRAKIGSASAYHAALIYGILQDKLMGVTRTGQQPQSNNFTFINMMSESEAMELMQRVMERTTSSARRQD